MAALIIPLVGHLLVNLMNWGIFSVSVQNMLMLRWVLSAELVSPSAALHGRGRGSLIVPKTTSLPSSLLPMVLRIALLDLPGYVLLLSTLPTLATTILRARCTVRLRTGTSGLVLCTIHRLPTTCTSVAAVSVRRTSAFVATVAPYAAPRSRVDSTLQCAIIRMSKMCNLVC